LQTCPSEVRRTSTDASTRAHRRHSGTELRARQGSLGPRFIRAGTRPAARAGTERVHAAAASGGFSRCNTYAEEGLLSHCDEPSARVAASTRDEA
jgi:hypothetical protein